MQIRTLCTGLPVTNIAVDLLSLAIPARAAAALIVKRIVVIEAKPAAIHLSEPALIIAFPHFWK